MLWVHHEVGCLDEMFNIFDDHNHPVVIVGDQALRWMAVGLMTNEARCKFLAQRLKVSTASPGLGPVGAR